MTQLQATIEREEANYLSYVGPVTATNEDYSDPAKYTLTDFSERLLQVSANTITPEQLTYLGKEAIKEIVPFNGEFPPRLARTKKGDPIVITDNDGKLRYVYNDGTIDPISTPPHKQNSVVSISILNRLSKVAVNLL